MRASPVIFRREAQEDIDAIAHYIAEDNPKAAEGFFVELDDLCDLLIHTPDIGSMRIFQSRRLRGMRVMPLKKFGKYLVFYRVQGDEIEIVRVLHGARDYPALF